VLILNHQIAVNFCCLVFPLWYESFEKQNRIVKMNLNCTYLCNKSTMKKKKGD